MKLALLLSIQTVLFAALTILLYGSKAQFLPDSHGYLNIGDLTLSEGLQAGRTLGYPLLLRAAGCIPDDCSLLPWFHWAILFFGVLIFLFCVRKVNLGAQDTYLLSTAFLLGCLQQLWLVTVVLPDFVAMVCSGVACGCLLWLVAELRSSKAWLALMISVTLSYHLRPSFVILIPLVPALLLVLIRARCRPPGQIRKAVQPASLLAAVLLTPFLAYATLRWLKADDFGLVAFSGVATSGMAVELLDDALANQELPASWRPFARELLNARSRMRESSSFVASGWVDMAAYENNYSANIHALAVPMAIRVTGDRPVYYDRYLREFAWQVIQRRKPKVLIWAILMYPRSAGKLLYGSWVLQILLPSCAIALAIRKWQSRLSPLTRPPDPSALPQTMAWIACLFFLANVTLLVLLGVKADSRYIVAGGLFLPSCLALLLAREITWILSIRRIEPMQ